MLKLGNYNAALKEFGTDEFKHYKADEEVENHLIINKFSLSEGFALEVINVYTGPPVVTFKFRHWGFFEGPFKRHAPTGEMVQFYGVGIMKVDESLRAENIEVYYDPAEFLLGLFKRTTNFTDPALMMIACHSRLPIPQLILSNFNSSMHVTQHLLLS
ncbi:hypothetical protein HAX54_031883 [Datura stramonium]|uniref:Pathogen-related protein n=1 Tax=Datura stramonium TaxID=4076 RepID=A0ABS8VB66_DATST|nr:hypothetical protein [Datura stramonium]